MKTLGNTFYSHGFLRGFCHLCDGGRGVQIFSSAADDSYDAAGRQMVEHMRESHGLVARQNCGQIEQVELKQTE